MDVVSVREHTEEIALPGRTMEQYLAAGKRVAGYLHWQIVSLTESSIVYRTPPSDVSAGEEVVVTFGRKSAVVKTMPFNDHDLYMPQVPNHAALYGRAMTKAMEEQDKADRNLHPMHREKYGALIPSRSYIITPIIVYLNVLVYVAMVIAGISPLEPGAEHLYHWGGNFRMAVMSGEWWRLVSYMFLHAGAVHLAMNTYALLYIGMYLEPLMGRFRFASAYVLGGVCAGLLSIIMHNNSVGVGASGAIFGMYGVFVSMLTTRHIERTMRRTMLRSIMFFVVFNLMYGLQGNTDNAAHIGGLLSGLVMGYVYYPGIAKHAGMNRQALTTGLIAAAVALLTLVTVYLLQQ